MHRQRAARCLGRLDQILGQLFEPCRLPVEHGKIFLCLFRLDILLFEKIDVVYNRGQRRFDVVRDICDEVRAEALGFELLLHRLLHALGDGIEVLAVVFQNAVHMVQVDACVEIACRECLAAGFELLKRNQDQNQKRRFCKLCDHPDHDHRAAAERREDKQLGKAYAHEDQTCLPVERQMDCAVGNAGSNCPQRARKKAQDIENDRVFPERAGFEACCKRHQNAHHEQHGKRQQDSQQNDSRNKVNTCRIDPEHQGARTNGKRKCQIQVKRNLIDPV